MRLYAPDHHPEAVALDALISRLVNRLSQYQSHKRDREQRMRGSKAARASTERLADPA
jgi:hypothetical protein